MLLAALVGGALLAAVVVASFSGLWRLATEGNNPAANLTAENRVVVFGEGPERAIPFALREPAEGEAPAPEPANSIHRGAADEEDRALEAELRGALAALEEGARLPFDSALWRESGRLGVAPLRFFMTGDFADRIRLQGRTAVAVEELLGPPELHGPGGWQYDLGVPPGSQEPHGLLLTFRDGAVSGASVVALRRLESRE